MIASIATNVSMAKVRACPVDRPAKAGSHWKGVKHGALMDIILAGCESRGWRPGDPRLHLSGRRTDFAMSVLLPGAPTGFGAVTPSLGVLASNSGFRRLRFFAGGEVEGSAVCCASRPGAKYVKGSLSHPDFDLAREARLALDWFARNDSIRQTWQLLLGVEVADDECIRIIVKAARDGMLPWGRVGHLDKLTRRHPHPTRLWDLLLHFGKVVGSSPAQDQMPQMLRFQNCLVEHALSNHREVVA